MRHSNKTEKCKQKNHCLIYCLEKRMMKTHYFKCNFFVYYFEFKMSWIETLKLTLYLGSAMYYIIL